MSEPVIDGAQGLRIEMVDAMAASALFADEAGLTQQTEMFGNSWAGDGEGARDFAGRLGSAAEKVEDGASGGVGESAENGVVGMGN